MDAIACEERPFTAVRALQPVSCSRFAGCSSTGKLREGDTMYDTFVLGRNTIAPQQSNLLDGTVGVRSIDDRHRSAADLSNLLASLIRTALLICIRVDREQKKKQ